MFFSRLTHTWNLNDFFSTVSLSWDEIIPGSCTAVILKTGTLALTLSFQQHNKSSSALMRSTFHCGGRASLHDRLSCMVGIGVHEGKWHMCFCMLPEFANCSVEIKCRGEDNEWKQRQRGCRVRCKISAVQMARKGGFIAKSKLLQHMCKHQIHCCTLHFLSCVHVQLLFCAGNDSLSFCLRSTSNPKEYSTRRWDFLHSSQGEFDRATYSGPKPHECSD